MWRFGGWGTNPRIGPKVWWYFQNAAIELCVIAKIVRTNERDGVALLFLLSSWAAASLPCRMGGSPCGVVDRAKSSLRWSLLHGWEEWGWERRGERGGGEGGGIVEVFHYQSSICCHKVKIKVPDPQTKYSHFVADAQLTLGLESRHQQFAHIAGVARGQTAKWDSPSSGLSRGALITSPTLSAHHIRNNKSPTSCVSENTARSEGI